MSSFDIRPLLTIHFWFDQTPPPLLPFFETAFFIVFAFGIAAAIVFGIVARHRRMERTTIQLTHKARRLVATGGILGFVLLFFAYERAPYLSARYLFGLLFLGLLVWAGMIFRWWMRDVPKMQKTEGERKVFAKYLPK